MDNELFFKLAAVFTSALVIGVTYFYVDAQRNGPTAKSMFLKMTGALGYLLTAVFCLNAADTFTAFDEVLLIAMCFSVAGDFFLHIKKHKLTFAIGFFSFLTAHIAYITAYSAGIISFDRQAEFFSVSLFVTVGLCLIIPAVYMLKSKLPFRKKLLTVPVLIYTSVLITMLYKASELGFAALESGKSVFACINAVAGAVFFVASDFSLLVLMISEKYSKSFLLKLFNMYTYFTAQLLLASLTLFI